MAGSTPLRTDSSKEKSVTGILVHLIGLFSGFVGAGIVYLLSNDDFSKSNAKNALNWQIFLFTLISVFVVLAFGLESVLSLGTILSIVAILLLLLLDVVFCLWAAIKAAGGTEWAYPITPEII